MKCQDFFKRRHFALSTLGDSSESEFLIIDLYLTGCTIKIYRGAEKPEEERRSLAGNEFSFDGSSGGCHYFFSGLELSYFPQRFLI